MKGLAVLAPALVGLSILVPPRSARACGGTFCDSGPQSMPVDQTGENILFIMDGNSVEAHIQIQYDPNTDAAKFAWLVPMTAVPQFSVGSQPLFDELLRATVPTYGLSDAGGCADTATGGDSGAVFIAEPDAGAGGGPDVLLETTVGAFEVVVLGGGTAAEVMQWLADNGYQQDPTAEPIIGEYLAENFLFAAFKLKNGADVAEIHPVVLKYEGTEPCVPLRLTRIAAADDMAVRTFFLGNARVAPSNYKHVLVNPLKIDWLNLGANYREVISLAVDHAVAEGRAFVTEYAGGNLLQSDAVFGNWDAQPFTTVQAQDVISQLSMQSLAYCREGIGCEFYHPLVLPLLRQYLPAPPDVPENQFYGCLSCNADKIDLQAWDGPAFAGDFDVRIVQPGLHAFDLVTSWPYVTRLFTLISPHEMILDPIFHETVVLPDVGNVRTATRQFTCNGPDAVVTLPDGREVFVPGGGPWPSFSDEMPWEEDIELVPLVGSPQVLVDQTGKIDALLKEWNDMHDWPGGADDGGNTTGTTAQTGTDTGADTGGDSSGNADPGAKAGCACAAGSTGGAAAVVPMLLLPVRRRRKSLG